MDITKMSVNDLKALAYDERNKIDLAQQNLNIINQEISKRLSQEDKKPGKESKK